jgi:hypothetical protein
MNAAIKGTSSGGKSEVRKVVLDYFPPEDVVSFTTLSERALLYYEADFAHKILSMGEAGGADEQSLQDYLLRELISEGRLRYPVVQKEKGGGLSTIVIEKNGPVCFLVTTTRNSLHPENETRLLSLEIDDTEKQTQAVLRKVAAIEGMNLNAEQTNLEPWQDFQRWIAAGELRVVVPFAETLATEIPAASVRLRRDFGQVLRAIKAHALIHRAHREKDEHGQIVAEIEHDYAMVRRLMNGIVAASSGLAAKPGLQETLEAVRRATVDLPQEEGADAKVIGKLLKLDRSAAWRRLRGADSEGYVRNLEKRRGQPGSYRLTGQKVEVAEMLPAWEVVKSAQPCNRSNNRQVFETLSGCASGCTSAAVDSNSQGDNDPFASLKDESLIPELPDFLDRRRRVA